MVGRLSYQHPFQIAAEAVACRPPGALAHEVDAAWLQGVRLGRDIKTTSMLSVRAVARRAAVH